MDVPQIKKIALTKRPIPFTIYLQGDKKMTTFTFKKLRTTRIAGYLHTLAHFAFKEKPNQAQDKPLTDNAATHREKKRKRIKTYG